MYIYVVYIDRVWVRENHMQCVRALKYADTFSPNNPLL